MFEDYGTVALYVIKVFDAAPGAPD